MFNTQLLLVIIVASGAVLVAVGIKIQMAKPSLIFVSIVAGYAALVSAYIQSVAATYSEVWAAARYSQESIQSMTATDLIYGLGMARQKRPAFTCEGSIACINISNAKVALGAVIAKLGRLMQTGSTDSAYRRALEDKAHDLMRIIDLERGIAPDTTEVSPETRNFIDSQTSNPTFLQNLAQVFSDWLHYPADKAGELFGPAGQMIGGLPASIFDSGVSALCGPTTAAQQKAAFLMTSQEKFIMRALDAFFTALNIILLVFAGKMVGEYFTRLPRK